MRTKTALTVIGATAALSAGGAVATDAAAFGVATSSASSSGVAAGPATKHVEGRIVAVSSQARTLTVRDRERGTVTFNVTVRTRFDRIAGFSALRTGERVDVRAARSKGRLVATKVEPGAGVNLRARHQSRSAGIRNAAGGSDDPVGHDVGDDRGGERGRDDGARHVQGDERGQDDGAGHVQGDERGRDDGAGHDRGDDHGGHRGRH